MKLYRFKDRSARRAAVVVAVFAGLGGVWLLTQSSALTPPPPPSLYLSPTTGVYGLNSQFSVQVRVNSATTPVNAVQADITYPSSLVEVVGIDTSTSAFTTQAETTIGASKVTIARGTTGGASISGDQLVATINLRTRAVSNDQAALAFVTGTELIESVNNTNLLDAALTRAIGLTFKIDGAAPVVTLTEPANNSKVAAGTTVVVKATATDTASAITAVDFYVDTLKVGTATAAPYAYNWNTAGLALGSAHTLQARAVDALGNAGSSALSTVTIADTTAPTVSLTAPAINAIVRGTVTLNANASDNTGGSGVAKVEFFVAGTKVGEDLTSPYSFDWASTGVADGVRALTAVAHDNAVPANTTTSTALNVTVDNTPPSAATGLTTGTITSNSVVLNWTGSISSDVTGYRITRNGTVITTTAAAARTYTAGSLTPDTAYTFTVVALDAAGNVSPAATVSATTQTGKIGDLNGDNQINITDLSILLTNWGSAHAVSDLNKNGKVDITDLSMLLTRWGK